MDNENEDVLEGAEVQEENAQEEVLDIETDETTDEEVSEDESITLTKAEFSKLNRKAKAYDATKPKKEEKKEEKTDLSTKTEPSNEKLERMELRLDGYSKEEVDEIMELGGTKVLGSKFVQSAIKAMRAEKKSASADTNFSAKSPVFKKYTQEDLSKMSSTELEKILPH